MEGEHEEEEDFEETTEGDKIPEITMYALEGFDTTSTIKIQTSIGKKKLALIDSGSTHNFIGEKAVCGMNLKARATKPFAVKVANGSPLVCLSRYDGILVTMGGMVFPVTLYALP